MVVDRLGGVPVVSTVDPVKDVRGGSVPDAVSSLGVPDSLSEADSVADSGADSVGSAEDSASVVVGGAAVGIALSVVPVRVGRSPCAATPEKPMVVRAARRKRADGDMRRDLERFMVNELFNLSNLPRRRRQSALD